MYNLILLFLLVFDCIAYQMIGSSFLNTNELSRVAFCGGVMEVDSFVFLPAGTSETVVCCFWIYG